MEYAPIALFVYKRRDSLVQVISSLNKCSEAKNTHLYVFSDAPISGVEPLVGEVRDYIKNIEGFKSVELICAERNLGLAMSVEKGIAYVLDRYEKVIVVEDDICVGPYFLLYMNSALAFYNDSERVMHVSGYMDPVDLSSLTDETFFYPVTSCWGWGTWRRAWSNYNPSALDLFLKVKSCPGGIRRFDFSGCDLFRSQLLDNVYGAKRTWAVKWMASVYLADGLCLHPKWSLSSNLGFGIGATNTKSVVDCYSSQAPYSERVGVAQIELKNNEFVKSRMREFYLYKGQKNIYVRLFLLLGKKVKMIFRDVLRRVAHGTQL